MDKGKIELVHSTERLQIRPLCLDDVPDVQKYADDYDIAKTTFLPYPYPEDGAKTFIESLQPISAQTKFVVFGIILKETNGLIGSISLSLDSVHLKGELGYWIGKPFWGKGYATEAVLKVIEIGFKEFNLNRIHACPFATNSASCHVLEKAGMKYEGLLRQTYLRFGKFVDGNQYAILKEDFEKEKK